MKNPCWVAVVVLFICAPLAGYAQLTFTLTSEGVDGGWLKKDFTCDGERLSPPLSWKNAPVGTKSFAITMHHYPPAGEEKHVYMVVYGLPSSTDHLDKGSSSGTWGVNTVDRKTAYTPPCSKGPGRKEYILTVYALSAEPIFSVSQNKVTMDVLLDAIKNTTLATATLTVGYERPR